MSERFNPESDPAWNRDPGIVVVPGSNYAKERAKFEQFPTAFGSPGNPYVYREFPKMMYRAEVYQGRIACGATVADSGEFANPNEYNRQDEAAQRFSRRCQREVKDEREQQIAMESGWRTTQAEAVAYLEARQKAQGQAAAERTYQDRNLSEPAKAEAKAAELQHFNETGRHLEAVPEKPVKRSHSEAMKKAWETRRAKAAQAKA